MTWSERNLAHTVQARGWRGSGRLDWCRGWALNAAYVAKGMRPNPHTWRRGDATDPNDRCYGCGRTRRQLMLPKDTNRPEPPPGSDAHLERALTSGD